MPSQIQFFKAMKKIYLVRHAKSSWSHHDLPDIDRPLNERGYSNAHSMANFLMSKGFKAPIFLSSPAIRAISTALIFSRAGLIEQEKIQIVPELYESSPLHYLNIIHKQDNQFSALYLFAHNPTISEVLNLLAERNSDDMTTCNVVILEFQVNKWTEIIDGTGQKSFFFTPESVPSL